jgi:outer membrane protein OmpA-like peptidoglycan-associated protein
MKTIAALMVGLLLSAALFAQEASSAGQESAQPAAAAPSAQPSAGSASAQDTGSPAQDSTLQQPEGGTPTYRVTVVSRTTRAINYRHRGGNTKVDFRGTELMSQAKGSATVDGKVGRLSIDAVFERMRPARDFGPEYLTYVLWAITPEGRPSNLGEVVPEDDKARLKVTSDLQSFGMLVTAEPYFAVTQPSNLVVIENLIRSDTKGFDVPIDARFEAVQRGQYTVSIPVAQLPATLAPPKTPLQLLEARNAVAIARATQAERYAPDSLNKAEKLLAQAEDYYRRKQGKTPIGTVARGATQAAEDARLLTIRRRDQEQQEARQRAARERAQRAEEQARLEAQQRQQAEAERQAADQARQQAEQTRQQAEAAAEEARRQQQLADQQRQQAEAARAAALAQQQAAQAETLRAQQATQQALQEKEQVRAHLLQQLNQVLQTKDTARGLVATMPDVLFDFGKYTLKPEARERLAKVAGIILSYPDLRLQIEGHTDNIGSDSYNQRLSEQRAAAVRDYLVSQGVPLNNVFAVGFGKGNPVASNSTPQGRQLNRRVDVVMSGAAIGNQQTSQAGGAAGSPATAAPAGNGSAAGAAPSSSPSSPAPAPATQAAPVNNPPPSPPQP